MLKNTLKTMIAAGILGGALGLMGCGHQQAPATETPATAPAAAPADASSAAPAPAPAAATPADRPPPN